MGQPTGNTIKVNPQQWKEVVATSTYIYHVIELDIPPCNGCGNRFKNNDKITRLQTSQGIEYYHYDKCLKGVELLWTKPS